MPNDKVEARRSDAPDSESNAKSNSDPSGGNDTTPTKPVSVMVSSPQKEGPPTRSFSISVKEKDTPEAAVKKLVKMIQKNKLTKLIQVCSEGTKEYKAAVAALEEVLTSGLRKPNKEMVFEEGLADEVGKEVEADGYVDDQEAEEIADVEMGVFKAC